MVNGASAGYVFLCSGTTESECITKGLFGASTQNFEQHISPETVLFLYNISSKQLKGLWIPRGNAGESIDPSAFNGSFKAQLAVQRTSDCKAAPLSKIQGIVRFYRPGRFEQHLTAQQVAALSLLLSLKPIRPSLTALQSKVDAAKPTMAALPKPTVAQQPSTSCKVTQPALVKTTLQSSAATDPKAAASGSTQSAALGKAPGNAAAPSNGSAVEPAKDSSASQPFAFQMNGLKGKLGSAAGGAQHKRRLSLAAVLDDVFEEVLSTPRSRKKRRRPPSVQLAMPLEQPLQPIDLTASPAKEQAAANPAHPPMSPIDLTGSGAQAVPAPAVPARKRVRKWDQMPEPTQSSAAAVQQEAARAPQKPTSSAAMPVETLKAAQTMPTQPSVAPKLYGGSEPTSSAAMPVDSLDAAQKLPARPSNGSERHENASGAAASQASGPTRPLHVEKTAATAPEGLKPPVQAPPSDGATQAQQIASLDPDPASKPLHVGGTATAPAEVAKVPVQSSAPDQAAQVQKPASGDPAPAKKPLQVEEKATAAPEAPQSLVQASAPDQAAQVQKKASMEPESAGSAVRSAPDLAAQVQKSATVDPAPASAAVKPLVPGCALICACSAQEADESFNRHQLPLAQKLREAHPNAVIRQGMRVFLHNADTRRLLGPFYAKQAKGSDEKVLVTEKEPVQALKEVDVLAKLSPTIECLADLGPVTEPSISQQICRAFQEAAIPNRIQPYRMLGGNLGGAVFVCSAGTVQSCLQKGLLGMMQDTYIPIVQHVSVGMPVFLFNHSDRTLLGPLSATSPGGMYLEERAWARPGHRSPWPAQARVAVHHPVIALQEKVFKPLVEAAYYSPNTFHFDLTKAEALSLLEAFTHRQVMYHQHLQHRQGHAYFVPPAMCQQLLEVARRVSRPPQQPARPQHAHINAYLAVLESGLSTQKKPAKRPDEETPPEPPPLEEILGRDPGELEPGELQATCDEAPVAVAAAAHALPVPAQQEGPCAGAPSGSAATAEDRSQQTCSGGDPPLPADPPSLQCEGAKQSTNAAAHEVSVPEKEPKPTTSLLERFDAARQQHSGSAVAMLASGGAEAVHAKPVDPSPLGRQILPMLSPLVLSSAPSHTPMQAHASSAPAAQNRAFSLGQAGQLQSQPGNAVHSQQGEAAGQARSEVSPAQCVRPEQSSNAEAAEPSSFSFALASVGQPPATPPSFVKLLQEYGITSCKPPAPEQPEQPVNGKVTARALRRRRARIRKLKEAVSAAAAKEAESAQETSEESAAGQVMPAAFPKPQAIPPASAAELPAAQEAVAASPAHLQAASDESAPVLAFAQGTAPLQPTPLRSNGPQLHGRVPDVTAARARSVQLSLHDYSSAPQQASPSGHLMPSLSSIIQEAAAAGTKLGAQRRSQLADAIQDAALAASQLHLALQSASEILRSEPRAAAPDPQDFPLEDRGAPCALALGKASQPSSNSVLMLTSGAEKQVAAPRVAPSKAAGPALQVNASKKRSRLANESSGAAESHCAGVVKKQKRSEGVPGTASGPRLARKTLKKVKQTDQQLLTSKDMPNAGLRSPGQGNDLDGQPAGQEAALSALTSLRGGVQAWKAAKACRAAGTSEDGSSVEAVITDSAADTSGVALEAQHAPEAEAAKFPGLAADSKACAATDEERISPPPDPPSSPPPVASPPVAFAQPQSQPAQPQSHPAIEHPSLSPPKQSLQHGLATLQASAFGAGYRRLPPQHAPHQAGLHPSMPHSRAAHGMQNSMALHGMHPQFAPAGNPQQLPQHLQMQGNAVLQAQQSSQPPWQLDMPRSHLQQQQRQQLLQTAPPQMQLGPWPAMQQPFSAMHAQPAPWQLQQQQIRGPGMPPQHAGQLWPNGQPWGPSWQAGLPPAQLPPPQQLAAPSGQLPAPRPPAHAPPLPQPQQQQKAQPPPMLPASSQPPPQGPRVEGSLVPAPMRAQPSSQPAGAASPQHSTITLAQRQSTSALGQMADVLETPASQDSSVHAPTEQPQQHNLLSEPLEVPVQAAALPAIGPVPVNPSAMPQSGVQGSFRFNAGKVGSAGRNKAKKRQGDLSNLQEQLEQQRAKFLQWHQQELNRAKSTGKRKTLKAKRKELAKLTQEFGDPETLKQVQNIGRDAGLAMSQGGARASAASVSTSLAGLQLGTAGAEVALTNSVGEHLAVQMTPLGHTVGVKRKRLQNGNMLSKLVAFDTNVYMGNNTKDPKVIAQVLRSWSLISPSVVILVPIVVMSELNCLATSKNRQLGQLAAGGLKVLQSVLASKIAHVQLPEELPEGCSTNRLKDDGILDCLRHFKEAGYHIFLCTRDKQFACRSQAQGIEAVTPDLLSTRPEYPLQVEMTPLPPQKRSRRAEGAAAAVAQPGPVQEESAAQHQALQGDLTAQPHAVQDDFIAL